MQWRRGIATRSYDPESSFVALVQSLPLPPTTEDYGAAIYYNTAIPVPGQPGRVMKYGVISTHALRQDLLDWRWMYAAGKGLRGREREEGGGSV
jgi:translocator assembly and maintenance protein 41